MDLLEYIAEVTRHLSRNKEFVNLKYIYGKDFYQKYISALAEVLVEEGEIYEGGDEIYEEGVYEEVETDEDWAV